MGGTLGRYVKVIRVTRRVIASAYLYRFDNLSPLLLTYPGKCMEAGAKSRTTDVVTSLMGLAAKTATLLSINPVSGRQGPICPDAQLSPGNCDHAPPMSLPCV